MSEQNAVHLASPDTHIKYAIQTSVRPSIRPKPELPSFDLNMGPLVHPTNHNRFTACPSVWRGFRAFVGECMEGLAWNFTYDVSWPSSELISLWP